MRSTHRIGNIVTQVTNDEPPRPSLSEMADLLISAANRIKRQDKLAAQAIAKRVEEAEKCWWCHGAAGYYAYGTGDEWIDCEACEGSGRKEG